MVIYVFSEYFIGKRKPLNRRERVSEKLRFGPKPADRLVYTPLRRPSLLPSGLG